MPFPALQLRLRFPPWFGLLSLPFLGGCQIVTYNVGQPPGEPYLSFVGETFGNPTDSLGRTSFRIGYQASWRIDSLQFRNGSFQLVLQAQPPRQSSWAGGWRSSNLASRTVAVPSDSCPEVKIYDITQAAGSIQDTMTCAGATGIIFPSHASLLQALGSHRWLVAATTSFASSVGGWQ